MVVSPNMGFSRSSNLPVTLKFTSTKRQKIYRVTWPWTRPLFGNICQGSCGDYPWEHASQIWSSYLQPFWSY